MRMILCARCVRSMREDRDVQRAGANSKKDKCQLCGKKSWCGAYHVAVEPREVRDEKKDETWLGI